MRYSLLSQFQGAFLGAAFGDWLGIRCQWSQTTNHDLSHLLTLLPPQSPSENKTVEPNPQLRSQVAPGGVELALAWTQSLIRHQGLDLQEWRETWQTWAKEETGLTEEEVLSAIHQKPEFDCSATPAKAAIATLPVALFFHEDAAKLRQKLQQVTEIWQNSSEVSATALAWGYAIAQALQQKLNPLSLIPQIITYLGEDTLLAAQLIEVQIMLEQAASLETAVTHLCSKPKVSIEKQESFSTPNSTIPLGSRLHLQPQSSLPIALSFYCFLSTPEDPYLTLARAAQTGIEPRLTCALAGALSGAYNSSSALPPGWQRALADSSNFPNSGRELSPETMPKSAQIKALAANLLAVWCGICDRQGIASSLDLIVAAPHVIRPHQY